MLSIEYIESSINLLENRLHRDYEKLDTIYYNDYLCKNIIIINKYFPNILGYNLNDLPIILKSLRDLNGIKSSGKKVTKTISNKELSNIYNFKHYISINKEDIHIANFLYKVGFNAILNTYKVLQK